MDFEDEMFLEYNLIIFIFFIYFLPNILRINYINMKNDWK